MFQNLLSILFQYLKFYTVLFLLFFSSWASLKTFISLFFCFLWLADEIFFLTGQYYLIVLPLFMSIMTILNVFGARYARYISYVFQMRAIFFSFYEENWCMPRSVYIYYMFSFLPKRNISGDLLDGQQLVSVLGSSKGYIFLSIFSILIPVFTRYS